MVITVHAGFLPSTQRPVFPCGRRPAHNVAGTALPQGDKRRRRGHLGEPEVVLRGHHTLAKPVWDRQSENQDYEE